MTVTRCALLAALTVAALGVVEGEELTVMLPHDVPLTLVRIPAGTFMMGSPIGERGRSFDREQLHQVTLTRDYFLGKYELTLEQWEAVMGGDPDAIPDGFEQRPAINLCWLDAGGEGGFIERLNQWISDSGQAGAGLFRLPTEAEWERAARAGTDTRFSFGDALECDDACASCQLMDAYMWWCGNASAVNLVGQKLPNQYGLYDMHGNVWEWASDWIIPGEDYPEDPQVDPTGPESAPSKVRRGGSYASMALVARSAYRGYCPPTTAHAYFGMRVARTAEDEPPPEAEFTWTPEVPRCGEPVQLTDLSSGDPEWWQWDFGDGTTADTANPIHAFEAAGSFGVSLTVGNQLGSDTAGASIDVDGGAPPGPAQAAGSVWLLPGVAHLAGDEGTSWVTDVVIHNPDTAPATLDLYLLEGPGDNSSAGGVGFVVDAGWALRIEDVVAQVFGRTGASGALLADAGSPLRLTARTFNDADQGTFGQYIPAVAGDRVLGQGEVALLIQLEGSERFRTNIGVTNAAAQPLAVTVDLYDADGTHLGDLGCELEAFGFDQLTGSSARSPPPRCPTAMPWSRRPRQGPPTRSTPRWSTTARGTRSSCPRRSPMRSPRWWRRRPTSPAPTRPGGRPIWRSSTPARSRSSYGSSCWPPIRTAVSPRPASTPSTRRRPDASTMSCSRSSPTRGRRRSV